MDEDKPHELAVYLYEEEIDGKTYGGEVVARNFEDAQRRVASFGKIIGRAIEEMDVQKSVCSICGGDITRDKTNPQPIEDEWQEEFE